tara:strand:+ start:1058 stop:3601 length:2544 start_codon:yes stop_codon:yes gene_type:complete
LKKIIITGGLGYIGMELSKIYSGKSKYYNITVVDNVFFSERVSQLKRWGIKFVQVDITEKNKMKEVLDDADIIYHLAGITDVGTTIEDKNISRDKQVRNVGVEGTKNIINLSPEYSKIVFPSTHVVYEGLKEVKKNITETLEPKPVLEYSKGKYQSEKDLINSGKNFIILRLGSVYGKSYDSTRLNIMPNLFSKITSSNGEIKLFSNGDQIKSLVSVFDVARCFEFVGENSQINREIYNCVNENMTVKKVGEICKKINKNLTLISTSDPVPNKGYSLSNKKLLSEGFEFQFSIEESIKSMISSWKDQEKFIGNEEIEVGKDSFIDDRGIITNYYIDDSINMIGYVESEKGSIRGNHYHPVQTQKCLLIKGKYISVTKDLLNSNSVVETRLISEGDMSTIPPHVAHTMIFLEDSIFLNLVNGEREHKNYGTTHTLKYDLVDKDFGELLLNSYKTECRVCGEGLNHYLSLGLSPLANNLNTKKNSQNDLYPLDLNFCKNCSNSQLSVVVPPKKMFSNYFYLSSTSKQFKDHFVDIAKELQTDLKLKNKSVVVDIGSNDGIFIDPVKKLGIKAVGVEPAKNVAKIANSKGLTTLPEYFNKKTVNKLLNTYGKVDVVTAFNVFAHGDGLKEILNNTEAILKKDGEFIFEIQYLLRTIKDLTFDNVYHEHVNYWCLLSILHFFENSKMKVYKVKEVDTHGGSLRVYATKNKNKRLHQSVNQYIQLEKKNKLDKIETYFKFAKDVENIKINSLKNIKQILSENKNIIGYGAPAKATTVLNYFGINDKYFKYVLDDSEIKHNKYIPETNIQIKSKNDIDVNKYDYILVLAWNFFDSIVKNNEKKYKKSKFIKLK